MKILPSNKTYVSKSTIHGLGVFSSKFIKKGELIEECPLIRLDVTPQEYINNNILFDYTFNWPPETNQWTEQVICLGFGSLYNHSTNPSARWKANYINKTLEFFSIKDIQSDEEIFVFYGDEFYWKDRPHTKLI